MPDFSLYNPLRSTYHHRSRPRRNLSLRLACLALLTLPLGLLILSILAYLDPSQSMRICLPFSLTRISSTAHQTFSCQYSTKTGISGSESIMSEAAKDGAVTDGEIQVGRLAGFLQSQKDLFLSDLKGGNLKGWIVAMGNEAGGECFTPLRHTFQRADGNSICRPRLPRFISRLLLPLLNSSSEPLHPPRPDTFLPDVSSSRKSPRV